MLSSGIYNFSTTQKGMMKQNFEWWNIWVAKTLKIKGQRNFQVIVVQIIIANIYWYLPCTYSWKVVKCFRYHHSFQLRSNYMTLGILITSKWQLVINDRPQISNQTVEEPGFESRRSGSTRWSPDMSLLSDCYAKNRQVNNTK